MVAQSYDRMTRIRQRADQLFGEAYAKGVLWRLLQRVLGRRVQLRFLDNYTADNYEPTRKERQAVDIDRIVGTSGRADRFDANFHPMQPRGKGRWASVAAGMMDDIMRMPPIEVVEVDGDFYVLDGHHRVSAARALRKAFIDANITHWERRTDDA